MPDLLVDSFNRVIGDGEIAFSVATCRTREPVNAAAARLAPGLPVTDVPDYLQWTRSPIDARRATTDPTDLHRVAVDRPGRDPARRRGPHHVSRAE